MAGQFYKNNHTSYLILNIFENYINYATQTGKILKCVSIYFGTHCIRNMYNCVCVCIFVCVTIWNYYVLTLLVYTSVHTKTVWQSIKNEGA